VAGEEKNFGHVLCSQIWNLGYEEEEHGQEGIVERRLMEYK